MSINIQGGRPGIELQASFFKGKEEKEERKEGEGPLYTNLVTKLLKNRRIFTRRLPVFEQREWLLIYEDALLELSVKDEYDELEIVLSKGYQMQQYKSNAYAYAPVRKEYYGKLLSY